MRVIDTSAFSKFLLKEEGWEGVVPYLRPEEEPVTVELLLVETANVLWKHAVKMETIEKEKAEELFEGVMELVTSGALKVEENSKYLDEAFKVALEKGITVYDALFIAQAKALNVPLITCDEKQGEIAREFGLKVVLP
ncbi:type II toxin-antitoxin system VapC family toxin [Thermococcus sp.]|uniref:type II toxin-antitoxin system VapC family toxin n=1 Tax=Thermococcus sp. TaxID=35749 RepID=UPI00261A368D|nr:type II toxin-antitoxin system VapC family toxin [Thermococcus sp.]